MDDTDTTLDTLAQFGPHFASLPSDLQDGIVSHAVQTPCTIQLFDLDSEIDTLSEPFENVYHLWLEARKQALRVNTFILEADKIVIVEHKGEPVIVCNDAGLTLMESQCNNIRNLQVTLKTVAKGCDWGERVPVKLSGAYAEIFATIPKVFPRLEALTIRVQNFGEREKKIKYDRRGMAIYPQQFSDALDRERRLQMMLLIRAFVDLDLPAWRMFGGFPRKTLVFSQTPNAVGSAAYKRVGLRRDKEGRIDVRGLAGNAASAMRGKSKIGDKWLDLMWEWCEFPQVRVCFVPE